MGTLQEDVYAACNLEALVEAALEGYSITLFAYGQVRCLTTLAGTHHLLSHNGV